MRAAWVLGGLVLALGFAAIGWIARDQGMIFGSHETGPSGVAPAIVAEEAKAIGHLEPAGDVVEIGAIVGDRLVDLKVREGDPVRKGQPLVCLDTWALRKLEVDATQMQLKEARDRGAAELNLAEARIAAAKLALEQAKTHEAEIRAEELKIPVLKEAFELAKRNQARLAGLSREIASEQQREQQDLAVRKAEAEWRAAEKLLDKDRRSNDLALKAAQAELSAALAAKQVALSSVPEESLKKKLELAQAQWERSLLTAPCDGTVLKVFLRPGELVGPGPILEIADLRRMAVIAEVDETEVKLVRVGQRAVITSRSFRSPYDQQGLEGSVTRIGRIISRPALKELSPLAPADRRAVEVRIELDEEASWQAKDFVHMQVDVSIPTETR